MAKAISKNDSVDVEPVIDRDTQGVAGTPDIASTIFSKIVAADLMVADVSIVSRPKSGRVAPNPNVLIELGYGFKALGSERIILVFNTAHGKIEELPFDLRARRVVTFHAPDGGIEKSTERRTLEGKLSALISGALEQLHEQTETADEVDRLVEAIENGETNKRALLLKDLKNFLAWLNTHQPKLPRDDGTGEDLLSAIDLTQDVMKRFTEVVNAVAVAGDTELADEIYQWFGQLYERYDLPRGFSGSSRTTDFDFFKFIGHEAFVIFIGALLRAKKWEIMKKLLKEPIDVRYIHRKNGPDSIEWHEISEYSQLLANETERRNKELNQRKYSIRADKLKERHESDLLAGHMPLDDFIAADYFLFLCSALSSEDDRDLGEWRPWIAAIYCSQTPPFIVAARRQSVAAQLVEIFGLQSIEQLRERLTERGGALKRMYDGWPDSPLRKEDIVKIGTQ